MTTFTFLQLHVGVVSQARTISYGLLPLRLTSIGAHTHKISVKFKKQKQITENKRRQKHKNKLLKTNDAIQKSTTCSLSSILPREFILLN